MSLNPVLDAYLKEVVEAGGSDLHLESEPRRRCASRA